MASLVDRRRARQSRSRPWKAGHSLSASPTNVDDDNASVVSTAVSFGSGTSTTLTESSLLSSALSKLAVVPTFVVSPLKIRLMGKKPCGIPRPAARVADGDDVEVIASCVDRRSWLAGYDKFLRSRVGGKGLTPSRIPIPKVMAGTVNPLYRAVGWIQPLPVLGDASVGEFVSVGDSTRVIASAVPKRSCLKKRCSRSVSTPKKGPVKTVRFGDQVDSLIGRPEVLVKADNPFYKAVDVFNLPSALQPEQLPSRFPKVRYIEMRSEYSRYMKSYQCEHALVWRRYLQVFYPDLRSVTLPGFELRCDEYHCISQREKRKGIEANRPWTQSFVDWADQQWEGHGAYDYFDCLNSGENLQWYWSPPEGTIERTDVHPAQRDLDTCACITGSGWWRHHECVMAHKPYKGPVQTF